MSFSHLVFLGTSSGVPTPERNVSGYTLTLSDGTHWLVDCGEGTQMQFGRARAALKGSGLNAPPLSSISRILITHLHGDHCYGLPGLLCSLSMARPKLGLAGAGSPAASASDAADDDDTACSVERFSPSQEFLEIVGPRGLAGFIRGALSCSDAHLAYKYRVTELWPACTAPVCDGAAASAAPETAAAVIAPQNFSCEAPTRVLLPDARGVYENIFGDSGGSSPVRVDAGLLVHPVQSLGYVLTEADRAGALDARLAASFGVRGKDLGRLKSGEDVQGVGADGAPCVVRASDCVSKPTPGRRLLFLGDTCDSSGVLPLGRGFAAVVHESTFDDASAALALPRGHSTARMAGAFAAAAGAEALILTHFSQRFRPKSKDAAAAAVMDEIVSQALAGYAAATNKDVSGAGVHAAYATTVVAVEDFSVVDLRFKS